jgi:hypothetical protein
MKHVQVTFLKKNKVRSDMTIGLNIVLYIIIR